MRVNDTVTIVQQGKHWAERVTSVRVMEMQGLYSPHTVDGDIVVDYILSSSHTFECPPSLANVLLLPFRVLFYLGMSKSVPGILDQGSALLIGLSELAGVSG